jgi:hypothetical protein
MTESSLASLTLLYNLFLLTHSLLSYFEKKSGASVPRSKSRKTKTLGEALRTMCPKSEKKKWQRKERASKREREVGMREIDARLLEILFSIK